MNASLPRPPLRFVTAVSNWDVLQAHLATSECFLSGCHALHLQWNAASAAAVFNRHMHELASPGWVVWVHQDVVLPPGWDVRFAEAISQASLLHDRLAVVGVYGVVGAGHRARRVGRVLDRGQLLHEPAPLPCLVDSLDELLFAVRAGSGLLLDPELGFDFYATDVVLQAQHAGLQAAVVDAYCEHWSSTPQSPPFAPQLIDRVAASGLYFETKWRQRLPVTTPIVHIEKQGDVMRQASAWRCWNG